MKMFHKGIYSWETILWLKHNVLEDAECVKSCIPFD